MNFKKIYALTGLFARQFNRIKITSEKFYRIWRKSSSCRKTYFCNVSRSIKAMKTWEGNHGKKFRIIKLYFLVSSSREKREVFHFKAKKEVGMA